MYNLAYFTFVLLGAASTVHGAALPFLIAGFGLSLSTAGLLLSAHFFGHLFASLAYPSLSLKKDPLQLITLSLVPVAVGLAALPLAPVWFILVLCGFVASLGLGTVDVGFNAIVSGCASGAAQKAMGWLHFSFALGALVSPFVFSFLLGRGLSWPFLYYFLSLFSALCIYFLSRHWRAAPKRSEPPAQRQGNGMGIIVRRRSYWLLLTAMFFYTAGEVALSGWIPTLLTGGGLAAEHASVGVSIFWLGLTLGRAVCARLSGKIKGRALLILLAGAAALFLLPFGRPLGVLAQLSLVLAVGFSFSGIFPLILLEGAALFPDYVHLTTSGLMVAASLGGTAGPALLGLIGEYYSLQKGIFALAGVMVVTTAIFLLLPIAKRRELAPGGKTGAKETN